MSTAVMPQNGMYDFGDIILKVNFPLHFGCVLTRQSSQTVGLDFLNGDDDDDEVALRFSFGAPLARSSF